MCARDEDHHHAFVPDGSDDDGHYAAHETSQELYRLKIEHVCRLVTGGVGRCACARVCQDE